MSEESTSLISAIFTVFVALLLAYAFYPVLDALNHTYAILFLFAVALMVGSLILSIARRVQEEF